MRQYLKKLSLSKTAKSGVFFHLCSIHKTLYFTMKLKKVSTSLLLMLHLRDNTSNELSLKKRQNPKRFFTYLVRSAQYSQNCVLYNDLEKNINVCIINAIPTRQYF